ncbi:dTDP-4-dehydrorhamnose reductase [Paenibacillus methanolicus]|uniref:dTDP-4-dehydrorhamnose reductase n=1 Tax=Paenibacillus methanolicus TaxID=582686 RepID=A0A5S5BSY6_9BACL|nr:dTDP-4-dehydrorhamnose reductase [Paenibacillus methanolicus]
MAKVAVTGANGQLGRELCRHFAEQGYQVVGYGKEKLDVTDRDHTIELMALERFDIVVHAGAYTKVDLAEDEREQSFLINASGTRNVAEAAEMIGAKLVYISTDYVFDGTAVSPREAEAPTNPINVYGASKLAGEQFVRELHTKYFIVRTAWVFGPFGQNFVTTMLKLAAERESIAVVNDQIGCPTYTVDLSRQIERLMNSECYGMYHVTNTGFCSWYEFARRIFELADIKIELKAINSSELLRKAKRPSCSILSNRSLLENGFQPLRPWEEALEEFVRMEMERLAR